MVAENPDLKEGAVALAGHLVFSHPEQALGLVKSIDLGDKFYDQAQDIHQLANFMQYQLEGKSTVEEALSEAQQAAQQQDWETTIQLIIKATMIEKTFANDLPRKTAIAFFHLWGDAHDLTRKYRKRFDMALY